LISVLHPASVAAVRALLDDLSPYVWYIDKADSCLVGKRSAWSPFDVERHRRLLDPIDSFRFRYGSSRWWRDSLEFRQNADALAPEREVHVKRGYSKHLPIVCYTLFLMDPAHKVVCDNTFPGSPAQCDSDRSPHHFPSIDIMLIADHSLCRGGPETWSDELFAWVSATFDLDVCANTVSGLGRVRSFAPERIFNRCATLRLDQYCTDFLTKPLLNAIAGGADPRESLWRLAITPRSSRFNRRYSAKDGSHMDHVTALTDCLCSVIVSLRIEKYVQRGFALEITRSGVHEPDVVPPYLGSSSKKRARPGDLMRFFSK
jgi:hypothetical protein